MKIDYVVKIGGSVLYNCSEAELLLDLMFRNKSGNYVVTVGSGYLGEMYKDFVYGQNNLNISFNDSVRDYSNIQSINASILASINNNYIVCCNNEEIESAIRNGKIPIADARGFLPIFKKDAFQKSDVRSANLCNHFGCKNLIVITNVSGIYDSDPNKNNMAQIINTISAESLKYMGRTAVDDGLAERLIDYKLNCNVVGIENLILNYGRFDDVLFKSGTQIYSGIDKEKTYE